MNRFFVALAFCSTALAQEVDQRAVAPDFNLGATSIYTNGDSGNGNMLLAQKATLSQAGTFKYMSFYASAPGGEMYLAVYADNNGTPGNLLAVTAKFTPGGSQWNSAVFTTPNVQAQPGTYWLAYHPSSNSLAFVKQLTGTAKYCARTFGAPPSPFCSPVTTGAVEWSMYATLTPLGAGPVNGSPSSPGLGTSKFGSMSFAWDPPAIVSGAPAVTGYRLYVGVGSSGCPGSLYVATTGTTGTYEHLPWGVNHTSQVTAMGSDGNESKCSNTAVGQPK